MTISKRRWQYFRGALHVRDKFASHADRVPNTCPKCEGDSKIALHAILVFEKFGHVSCRKCTAILRVNYKDRPAFLLW